jgi:membrane fusion protein (multidrug efflux system)
MNEMRRIEGGTPAAMPIDVPVEEPAPRSSRRRLAWMLALPLLLAAVGLYLWLTSGKTVATDNAQVAWHVVRVAPEVSGPITEVFVSENQQVKGGDLLYRIDPAPYRIALMQSDAAVGNARLQINQIEGDYSAKLADIGAKVSDVQLAQENFGRQKDLLARGFTTRAAYDSARAALAMLGSSVAGGHPQVEAAIAQRDKAALDLKRTEIRAPIAGIISQTDRLNTGAMATQMLPNVSIVGGGAPWVEANFKETQLAKIRPGQPVEFEIDAYGGCVGQGTVASVSGATGAKFALLPPDNATGNFTKVVQRVPVRIAVTRPCAGNYPLRPGLSASVHVDTSNR